MATGSNSAAPDTCACHLAACCCLPCLQGSLLKILVLQQLHLLGDLGRSGEIKLFAEGMASKLQARALAIAAAGQLGQRQRMASRGLCNCCDVSCHAGEGGLPPELYAPVRLH